MLSVKTKDPWISLREFMLMLLYLAVVRLQDVCLYGYGCLTDPRLHKADHCRLSLSRALACCAVF